MDHNLQKSWLFNQFRWLFCNGRKLFQPTLLISSSMIQSNSGSFFSLVSSCDLFSIIAILAGIDEKILLHHKQSTWFWRNTSCWAGWKIRTRKVHIIWTKCENQLMLEYISRDKETITMQKQMLVPSDTSHNNIHSFLEELFNIMKSLKMVVSQSLTEINFQRPNLIHPSVDSSDSLFDPFQQPNKTC